MIETWRSVKQFPECEVSDLGRVRSRPRTAIEKGRWAATVAKNYTGRILKDWASGSGYRMVSLGKGHDRKIYVHRLVADAFLAEDSGRVQINHKNGDKADNRLENLERVTQSENMRHSTHVLQKKGGQFVGKLTAEQVHSIRVLRQTDGLYMYQLAAMFGVSTTTVCRALQG